MSEYAWDDVEDEDQQSETPSIKQIRAALNKANKRAAELEKELAPLRQRVRKSSVADLLTELGRNPKVAGLVPDSVEPTKDGLTAWLKDYQDVLPALAERTTEAPKTETEQSSEPALQQSTSVDEETAAAFARMQQQETGPGSTTPDQEAAQLAALKALADGTQTADELLTAFANSGQPTQFQF